MKRIISLSIIILFLYCFASASIVEAAVTSQTSQFLNDKPEIFTAHGFSYTVVSDEIPPFHRLQHLIDLQFMDKETIHETYTIDYPENSSFGPAVHTLYLNLTYERDLLESDDVFITGNFRYQWDLDGTITDYTGIISGSLIEIDTDILELDETYRYTNAIALELMVDDGSWKWIIYLEIPGEEQYFLGAAIDSGHEEEPPHVPAPQASADVAAGVGVSAIGIAVVNALTKTSVMGGVSLTPSVNLPPQSSMGANIARPVSETGGGFFASISKFFKSIFSSFRDMLTDEGRSYASGRLSESLGEAGIDFDMDMDGSSDGGGDGD